jgi:hypothetical protein
MAKRKIKEKESKEITVLENGFTRNQSRTSPLITTSKNNLSAMELKVFYQLSTLINMEDGEFEDYEININEFMKAFNITDTNKTFIKNTCKKLAEQVFQIFDETNGDYEVYPIFWGFKYRHKEQKIIFGFNERLMPYLLNLRQFTKIEQVKYIKEFDSKYAIRIYALLKDYRLLSEREINLEELKTMLDLGKGYSDFAQINRKVLKPAFEEINAKSDLEILEISPKQKQGKKIVSVLIKFRNKVKKQALDMLNYLNYLYKRNKGDLSVFEGYFYALPESPNLGDILRISSIKELKDGAFAVYKGKEVIFKAENKKVLLNKLFGGIYNALNYGLEKDKKVKLAYGEFKTQEEKLKVAKQIAKKWRTQWLEAMKK